MSRRGNRVTSLPTDRRAAVPAVSKAMEVAIVLLFVGAMTTALYGGAVPSYRDAAGAEVADRTVAAAALRVEAAIPPPVSTVRVVHRVPLPTTIRGAAYTIAATDGVLVLDHPDPHIDALTPLTFPDRVVRVTGRWESGAETVVVVRGVPEGLVVRLDDRDERDRLRGEAS